MKDASFKTFVEDQLRGISGLVVRAMFGGYGLYAGPAFFGIIFRGRLYLKVDPASREAFVTRRMRPFRPSATQTLTSFYEAPADVLEDPDELAVWAGRAVQAARTRADGTRASVRRRKQEGET